MPSGIYCIKNERNGKVYIGSSINIHGRWMYHKSKLYSGSHDNSHLQRAYDKYGKDSFTFSILEQCPIEELENREDFYIELNNATNPTFGYNKKWAFGRGKRGCGKSRPMLENVKKKLSKALKGRPKSEEWKDKVRKPKSSEWKRRIGDAHLNKKLNINKTSNYIGVYKHNKNSTWISTIRMDGKKKYLGSYTSEKDAAKAFDNAYCSLYKTKEGLNNPQ